MGRFSVIHRVSAVLSSALLLQLSLLGSGTACRMHDGRAMASMGGMSALDAGNAMHASHAAPRAATMSAWNASSRMPLGTCGNTGAPCDAPWTPGGCASMSACATAVASLAASTPLAPTTARAAVQTAASARIPLGPTFAPDLPPPRV